jgi:YidC/Oxa1 family membrane protein insertase
VNKGLSAALVFMWAGLLLSPARADSIVETDFLQLRFDDRGQLIEAVACHPECGQERTRRFSLTPEDGVVTFGTDPDDKWNLDELETESGRELHFQGKGESSRRWIIPDSGYGLGLVSHGLDGITIKTGEEFRPRSAPGFGEWLEQIRYLTLDSGEVKQISLDDAETKTISADWVGFRSRFWTVLVTEDRKHAFQTLTGESNQGPELSTQAGPEELNWYFYIGPVERSSLAAVDELLPDMMYAGLWFWLRWICMALEVLLAGIQSIVVAWGPSIVLLSICVGILMAPLTRLADRVQQQVNATEARLAPELSRIKREFKGEQQAAKIIALYKTERVHPLYSLKSLLGVAVVIPVFIGAFDMLAENIHLMNTPFLWVQDLSRPDMFIQMPFELPFFGNGLNLLPVLMTALSVVASLLHRPLVLQADLRQRQVRNMILLAAAFFVLFYTFPAGMVLYWTTNNLISVCKSLWARVFVSPDKVVN